MWCDDNNLQPWTLMSSLDLAAKSVQKGSPGSFRRTAQLLGKQWKHQVWQGLESAPCAPQAPEKACGYRRYGTLWHSALHHGSAVTGTRNTGTPLRSCFLVHLILTTSSAEGDFSWREYLIPQQSVKAKMYTSANNAVLFDLLPKNHLARRPNKKLCTRWSRTKHWKHLWV